MRKNVLVFPCGSEIGLEIYRSLESSAHFKLFGASSVEDHGSFVYQNYIGNLPFVNDNYFIRDLKELVAKYKIDLIFPAHDDAVVILAENSKILGCTVIGSDFETALICRSKSETYKSFKPFIKVPEVFESSSNVIDFPVFLKPDKSQGSKGTVLAKTKEEILFFQKKDQSLLILEYLPGKEYTVDCFTDRTGKLLFVGPRERIRIQNGISVNTKPITNNADFRDLAEKINNHLELRGVWFFQVKRNKYGELVLLEIAPRVAGSMAIQRNIGVNLPLLSIWDALDQNVEIIKNDLSLEMDRALVNRFKSNLRYNTVYVDLDDCLVLNKQLNIRLVSFLFKCLRNKIKVKLLTRHKKDLTRTLEIYKIANIFSEIILIDQKTAKSNFIKEKDAIFIDDSFAERKEVHKNTGITVFDASAVESLFESL